MKTKIIVSSATILLLGITACSNHSGEGRFLNLSTGKEVEVVKSDNGEMIDKKTGKPVLLYTDENRRDTFYGVTGQRINGHLQRVNKGIYVYDNGEEKIKIDGVSKEKWDADGGEYKYKDDDTKIKSDNDDYKVKTDVYTKKVDEDGDVKYETKDKKIKIDGETGERKVKNRSALGKLKDKVIGD